MSVRGGKNKIFLYVAGAFSIAVVILLYHNASQRLEDMEKSYERCHMNEESLSAQLQVILEYKMRLEKSLQQEKSDHAQSKEELQNKLQEEKQTRERENSDSITKFQALQQSYKLLQSQHEDVNQELTQLKKLRLSDLEDKGTLETQIQSLKDELKLVKNGKENDVELWKSKYSKSERDRDLKAAENKKLIQQIETLEKENEKLKLETGRSNDKMPITLSRNKPSDDALPLPETVKKPEISKSSTVANKAERELFPSGNLYLNTSTPMINPEAVQSQDKIPSAFPVPQPKQASSRRDIQMEENKENVGAKPDEMNQDNQDHGFANAPMNGGVLRPPGFVDQFQHVPAIQSYKERLKQVERNDHGGEVGDEGEPVKIAPNDMSHWRDGEIEGQPFVRHPVGKNEIPRNQVYHYPAEYGNNKEDDDDDVDQIDDVDQNLNEKHVDEKIKSPEHLQLRVPIDDKQDGVMVQPK